MGCEPGVPSAPDFGATGLSAPLRVVELDCSAPPSVTTSGGGPSPATFLRSQEHSASVARLLLRANRKIPGHCPGRIAAQAINDAVEKLPSLSTNWFSGGRAKSSSSEIAFTQRNAILDSLATLATPAASISTTRPWKRSTRLSLEFCPAISAALTSTPPPTTSPLVLQRYSAPLAASITTLGVTTLPAFKLRISAPARPTETSICG